MTFEKGDRLLFARASQSRRGRAACHLFLAMVLVGGCAAHVPLVKVDESGRGPDCISNVRIFDGVHDDLSDAMDVTLASGRIESIRPAAPVLDPQCVDGTGKTLMPGLIDAHGHAGLTNGLPPWDIQLPDVERHLQMYLASGVTTVLVPGASADLPETIEDLGHAAPTIFRASRIITAVEGHPIPMFRAALAWPVAQMLIGPGVAQVANETEVAALLDAELTTGPDFIKVVYDDMPTGSPHLALSTLRRIVTEARARGVRVIVHVGSAKEAVEAAESGAAVLMHTPWEDLLTDDDVERIKAAGVPMVTTRNVFGALTEVLQARFKVTPLEKSFSEGAEASFDSRPAGFALAGFDAAYEATLVEYDANVGVNVKKLFDAGVVMLAGTDAGLPGTFQGASLHRELASLVALGIKPVDALRSATSIAARFLAPSSRFGVVEPGAVADVLLIDGDPLQDIGAVARVSAIWKTGHRVTR